MTNVRKLFPSGSLTEADLRRDIDKNSMSVTKSKLLEIKEANSWIEDAKLKPIPKKLVDCLWYQGELCILFADTNLGKSIFAVQIANALTKGESLPPFEKTSNEGNITFKVLYCDFEMSIKQFENRYSYEYCDHHQFSQNFFRAELNLDEIIANSEIPLEQQIGDEIINQIRMNDIDVVIIDNLTYIAREIEKSKNIAPLMQKLKWINKEYGTSIMVLAHTPKRDNSKPITNSDIAGSKFLSNFADSIIAIGKSTHDESLRYIKQIKSRNSGIEYGESEVILYSIEKPHNFILFKFAGFDSEINHLQCKSKEQLDELNQLIIATQTEHPDWSLNQIAEQLGTYKMKVKRTLDKTN